MDFFKYQNVWSLSGGDFLWVRSGAPDPVVKTLETLLGPLRHDSPAPVFPAASASPRWNPFRRRLFPVAAAAALSLGVVIFVILGQRSDSGLPGWNVSSVSGSPRIGSRTVGAKLSRLSVGQILETDLQSRAQLHADDIGRITVEPATRLRLLAMNDSFKHIALDHGTIHAYIWATPGQFVVDTPSATTVDLGCAYTLHVDDSGAGVVHTSLGWVGFKLNGRESFIPAGAACATRPKTGPGTPYIEDTSVELRAALTRFDFEDTTPQERAADVAIVLRESRKQDALTLWHLLARFDDAQRAAVYGRLRMLVPPPASVTWEGVSRLDQSMLDQWWNELGFDDISVWRQWERSWPSREK